MMPNQDVEKPECGKVLCNRGHVNGGRFHFPPRQKLIVSDAIYGEIVVCPLLFGGVRGPGNRDLPLLFGVATRRETATHLLFLSLFRLPDCSFC
jgi:hypothetical protein